MHTSPVQLQHLVSYCRHICVSQRDMYCCSPYRRIRMDYPVLSSWTHGQIFVPTCTSLEQLLSPVSGLQLGPVRDTVCNVSSYNS